MPNIQLLKDLLKKFVVVFNSNTLANCVATYQKLRNDKNYKNLFRQISN